MHVFECNRTETFNEIEFEVGSPKRVPRVLSSRQRCVRWWIDGDVVEKPLECVVRVLRIELRELYTQCDGTTVKE